MFWLIPWVVGGPYPEWYLVWLRKCKVVQPFLSPWLLREIFNCIAKKNRTKIPALLSHDRKWSHFGDGLGTSLAIGKDPYGWSPPPIRRENAQDSRWSLFGTLGDVRWSSSLKFCWSRDSGVHHHSCNSSAELKEGEGIDESIALQPGAPWCTSQQGSGCLRDSLSQHRLDFTAISKALPVQTKSETRFGLSI